MKTRSESSLRASSTQEIATKLRVAGWLSFWLQLALAVATGLTLLFAISGRNFSQENTPGIGVGIFWAATGVAALCFTIYLAFRYTQIARRLRSPNPEFHPKKSDVAQLLRLGVVAGLVGMLLTILGAGGTLGVLLAKAVSQPQGVAIYSPARIIRALDIFVAVANMNCITAHFVGSVASLWLLDRVNRHESTRSN